MPLVASRRSFSTFSLKMLLPAVFLLMICSVLSVLPGMPIATAAAEETPGEYELIFGGYTFERFRTVGGPNVFFSRNPAADSIVLQENSTLMSYSPFWFSDFEQWERWYNETSANPDQVGAYGLVPLAPLTVGTAYNRITLAPGARIINTAEESDGIMAFGGAELTVGEDAMIYGDWAGLSFGNFKDPSDLDFYEVSILNQGRIGSLVDYFDTDGDGDADDDGDTDNGDAPPPEYISRSGILLYEAVGGSVLNDATGVIKGRSFGIRTNYVERQGDFIMLSDDVDDIRFFEGRELRIENYGEIIGHAYDGIFDGGGLENLSIINHESGVIKGGRAGIVLFRGGEVDNRGTIQGGQSGIYVVTGTADITHSGTLSPTDSSAVDTFDAIRFGKDAVGGTVTLLSSVNGNILHLGDSSEAVLSIGPDDAASDLPDTSPPGGDAADEDGASVGHIDFGEGSITQYSGIWSYRDIAAAALTLEDGEMRLREAVSIDQDITIEQNAAMTISGGEIAAENFYNSGTLNFYDGELTINGGVFDHSAMGGFRDLNLLGNEKDQNPHLRLADGAFSSGINQISIGGDYAGRLTLEDASVSVPGGLATKDKGRLAGAGSVSGNVTVEAGGALAPGYSDDPTGTLFIEGSLNLEKGSTLEIGVQRGDDESAKVDVSGAVSIEGGTVSVVDLSGRSLEDGAVYTFLTTSSSLAGEFEAITGSPIYGYQLNYGFNDISFRVTRLTDYEDFAETPNQAEVARVYQLNRERGDLSVLVRGMERLLSGVMSEKEDATLLPAALSQLNPEPFQAAFRMTADQVGAMNRHLLQGARKTRQKLRVVTTYDYEAANAANFMGAAMAAANGNGPATATETQHAMIVPGETGTSTWGKPFRLFYGTYYRFADLDPHPGRTGHYQKGRGFYLGYEKPVGKRINAGVSIGYAINDAGFNQGLGRLEMESFRLGPHATVALGSLEIDIALSGGLHLNRHERHLTAVPALPATTAVSRYKIYDGSAFTDIRYTLTPWNLFSFSPSASMQYTYQRRQTVKEERGGDMNLKVDKNSLDTLRGLLGATINREIRGSSFVVVPEIFAGWRYDMMGQDVNLAAEFAGASPDPDRVMRITGEDPDRHLTVLSAGITALFGDFNVAYLGYEREIMDSGKVESFFGGVKWNF